MHLIILAVISAALLIGGIVAAFWEANGDTVRHKVEIAAVAAILIGLLGSIVSILWGVGLLWEAIHG